MTFSGHLFSLSLSSVKGSKCFKYTFAVFQLSFHSGYNNVVLFILNFQITWNRNMLKS